MPSSLLDALIHQHHDVPEGNTPEPLDLPVLVLVLDRVPDKHNLQVGLYRLGPVLALCMIMVLDGAVAGTDPRPCSCGKSSGRGQTRGFLLPGSPRPGTGPAWRPASTTASRSPGCALDDAAQTAL